MGARADKRARPKVAHVTTVDLSLRCLLLNQLERIRDEGYDVVGVSAPGPDVPILEAHGIPHFAVPMTRRFTPIADLRALMALARLMRRERFDIVHTHTPKAGLLGQLAARLSGVPVVVNTVHGFYFHKGTKPVPKRFYIWMERIAAQCSDVILSQNREDMATAVEEHIAGPDLLKWLGNGIDVARFDRRRISEEVLEQLRTEIALDSGAPVVGFVGRLSRTGKALPPKYGLLKSVVDSATKLRGTKVKLVPVSIGYERIIEERSFVHELSGGEKQSENMGGLIKSSSVLRSKWGRLYVQFGEIIDFDEFASKEVQRQGSVGASIIEIAEQQQRAAVRALAHKVMYSINEVTVVTPAALVATALLSHQKRGMTQTSLLEACETLHATLEELGARVAHQLRVGDGRIREDTIDEASRCSSTLG